VNEIVLEELKRIVEDSKILGQDDKEWPKAEKSGKQEMEIMVGNKHICF